MALAHFTYLLLILIFMGLPFTALTYIYRSYKVEVQRYKTVILRVAIFGILLVLPDYFGLRWGAWFYNPAHTLGLRSFVEPETFAGALMIFSFGAAATLTACTSWCKNCLIGRRPPACIS